jgi:hypothetical protein
MPWRLLGTSNDGQFDVTLVSPNMVTIGRDEGCTHVLVQKQVSRRHVELHWAPGIGHQQGHWRIRDCGSTAGTFVNSVKLTAHQEVRLNHRDVIEIRPWKFQVVGPSSDNTIALVPQTLAAESEIEGEFEALSDAQSTANLAQGLLVQLVEASQTLHKATDEESVGLAAVESLSVATGFANIAFLKGTDWRSPEVVAHRGAILGSQGELEISRSLLKRSMNGIYILKGGVSPGTLGASLESLAIRQAISVPVEVGTMFFGWLYLDNRTGSATESPAKEVAGFAKAVASMLGLALSNIQRSQMQQRFDDEKKDMVDGTMRALIEAIDAKDPYTRGHSDRVSKFAMLLARTAKLSEGEIKQAGDGGLLHDIGKIGVSEKILCKPTHLDPEEFAQIQEHPRLGHKILKNIPQVRDLLPGMLQHHERWDGSGYPDNLKGEQISQLGRILCIADCFDAMTSARFYRPARSISEVRAEIKRCLGTHFDPKLGEIFLSIPESELLPLISTALQPAAQ